MKLLSPLLLASGVGLAAGFVPRNPGSKGQEPMRWSIPENSEEVTGLGAGISYAIASDFGDKMTPLFKENDFRLGFQFVTTESLNDALQRSMFQWANNHKYLTFFNVSDKCQPKDGKDCEFAELYIHAKTGGEKYEWAPVKVFHEFREPDSNVTGGSVRTTAGEMIDAKEISKAEVVFFTDHPVEFPDFRLGRQCFYLDETFCVPFQERQKTTNIKLTTEIVCFVLWAIAFLMALKRMLEYVVAYCQKRYEGVKMLARVHAAHILYSYFTMLMLIFPPAFYWVAAYPCFLCYSFESLAVGAIGQVLGFNYVNAADVQNFKVTEAMGTKTCSSPDNFIEETGVDSASVLMEPDEFSANYCLTNSDLDGLYYLYPLCDGAKLKPGCLRSKTNVGFLRVGVVFGAPFFCVSVIIFLTLVMLRRVERKASEDVKKRLAVNAFISSPLKATKRKESLRGAGDAAMGGGLAGAAARQKGKQAQEKRLQRFAAESAHAPADEYA